MDCPIDKEELKQAIFYGVEVDFCPTCLGLWFEEDELRLAKDEKDKNLRWLDIDLWKDVKNFKIFPGIRLCPFCRLPLYEIYYGDSKVIVDVCNLCHGVWLDRGEFKKIIEYLKEKAGYEVLNKFAKNLLVEAAEILIGPETLREEILDFFAIIKVLNYKFLTQQQKISEVILNLPK